MNDIEIISPVEKLDYIDALRGIAILMVILVHTSQAINGISPLVINIALYGQVGVQLFFIASAYTLCFSKIQRAEQKRPLISFFIRRFFRIAPLYYVAIAWYFLLESNTHILSRIKESYSVYDFNTVIANIMFIHGFVPSANNNIVPGGWSIGTEMAFYLLFPVLFSIFKRSYKHYGILSLYGLVGLSISLNIFTQLILQRIFLVVIDDNSFIYCNLINQLPVFLLGMTVFFHHQHSTSFHLSLSIQALCFCLLTIFGVMLLPGKQQWLVAAVLPIISGVSFVFLLNVLRKLKYSNIFLREIGQISYSMYIFHFMFAWYLVPGIGLTLKEGILPDFLLVCSMILVTSLTFFTATISQKYIESPGIWLGKTLISKL